MSFKFNYSLETYPFPDASISLQLHGVGTAASVVQVTAWTRPQPHYSLIVKGLCRFQIKELKREVPFPIAEVTQLDYLQKNGN